MPETRHQKFERLSKNRVETLKDKLRILGNLSDTSSYEYTQEDVASLFSDIMDALQKAKDKFERHLPIREPGVKEPMKTESDGNVSLSEKSNGSKRKRTEEGTSRKKRIRTLPENNVMRVEYANTVPEEEKNPDTIALVENAANGVFNYLKWDFADPFSAIESNNRCISHIVLDDGTPDPVTYGDFNEDELPQVINGIQNKYRGRINSDGPVGWLYRRLDVNRMDNNRQFDGDWIDKNNLVGMLKEIRNHLNDLNPDEKDYVKELYDIAARIKYSFTPTGLFFSSNWEIRIYYNLLDQARFGDELKSVLAHEMFHAYHCYLAIDTFREDSLYANVVKEASADFFSYCYCKVNRIHQEYLRQWYEGLLSASPYAKAFFYLSQAYDYLNENDIDERVFNRGKRKLSSVSSLSIESMRQAYNKLVPTQFRQSGKLRRRKGDTTTLASKIVEFHYRSDNCFPIIHKWISIQKNASGHYEFESSYSKRIPEAELIRFLNGLERYDFNQYSDSFRAFDAGDRVVEIIYEDGRRQSYSGHGLEGFPGIEHINQFIKRLL